MAEVLYWFKITPEERTLLSRWCPGVDIESHSPTFTEKELNYLVRTLDKLASEAYIDSGGKTNIDTATGLISAFRRVLTIG